MAINTVINTNMMALTAHRNLASVGIRQSKASQRLSSGKKINSAADDAAGLAISEKMKAQIKGLDMAAKNSEDAISLVQTAEGSLTEVNDMLTRVRELTVQAANDTNQQEDRVKIAEEVGTLLTEIDSISGRTEFNEKKLNDGSFQDGFFQIGANKGQKLDLGIGNMSVSGIGANGIRDAFGLDKKVELNPESSAKGAISAGSKSSVQTSALVDAVVADGNKLKSGTLELGVKLDGVDTTLSFDIDLSNLVGGAGGTSNKVKKEDLAKEVVNQLRNNEDFSSKFEISDAGSGKLNIVAKEEGGNILLDKTAGKIKLSLTSESPSDLGGNGKVDQLTAVGGSDTKGNYGTIDFTKIKDGDTITVGGKTYTKVKDADIAKQTYGGFNDINSLKSALEADGIHSTKSSDKLTLDFADQNSPLAGTYTVDPKKVSDKGMDYSKTIETVDKALKAVTTQRAKLGANQNRLEHTINNLKLSSENLSAAKSRIEDTDMAKEMMNLTAANVLQQAATSMLAQANQAPNKITQLLG